MRPCESCEQSIFSWQIMFTSKFKNTHPHLEEMPSRFLCDLSGHICGQYCLACGQLSFYCFISASGRRNNGSGPSAASASMHKLTHNTYTNYTDSQTCILWTYLDISAYTHMQLACSHAHNPHGFGKTISSVPFSRLAVLSTITVALNIWIFHAMRKVRLTVKTRSY